MIGLGVGIDYALFIVTRYRQGLAEGRDPREATAVSLATSGRAVVFAGTTVILSLLGPVHPAAAVHARPGRRGHRRRGPGHAGRHHPAAGHARVLGPGHRQAARPRPPPERRRTGRPGLLVPVEPDRAAPSAPGRAGPPCSACSCCIVPFFSMRLAFTDAGNDPTSRTTRQAFDALATGFGPGFNGPLIVAASVPDGQRAAVDQLQARRDGHRRAWPSPRRPSSPPSGHDAVIIAYPTTSPAGGQDRGHRPHLRDDVIPACHRRHRRGWRTWAARRPGRSMPPPTCPTVWRWVIGAGPAAVLPPVDGRVPVAGHPGEGGGRQPAVGGGRLRGHRGRLPVGMAGRAVRDRGHQPDRPVDPAHDVHHPVRPVHGLRGVPALADPGGVAADRRQLDARWPTDWPRRPGSSPPPPPS